MIQNADVIVIGGGIAGASAAAELAAHCRVILLEMESQPGFHATGRSAAFFAASYGNEVVRGITAASEPFFRSPPSDFTEVPLLQPRDCIFVGRADQQAQLDAMKADNPDLQSLSAEKVLQAVPILSQAYVARGLRDVLGGNLDVDAVLQGYLRLLKKRGGQLVCSEPVVAMNRSNGRWQLEGGKGQYAAPIVVNAAGAWVDPVAELAGLKGLGHSPMRRTALLIDPPEDMEIQHWPLLIDADEEFYFKPDAGLLLISPADETPSQACDAQAEELDIAIAIDRFEKATGLAPRRVNHRWAGLRTFAPDRTFVAGFDPRTEGFFWLAGQGGYGVQSAPGLSHLATALITGSQPPEHYQSVLAYVDDVSPARLL